MLTTIAGAFALLLLLEQVIPGGAQPKVRNWSIRVVVINAAQLVVVLVATASWQRWLTSCSILHLSRRFDAVPAGLIAYFVATFLFYWWHRWRHQYDLLWLSLHQLHHSPQRLEVVTSFYKHPVEMVVDLTIGSVLVNPLLGLSTEASAVCTLCAACAELFYHSNISTPRWVGYVFQRPEMHRIHHQYGRHKNNYGDITWWDMLFGTYENPIGRVHQCGFDDRRERQWLRMLVGEDVNRPRKRLGSR